MITIKGRPILLGLTSSYVQKLAKRFKAKVRVDAVKGCHIWTGGIHPRTGYGRFSVGGRKDVREVRAHRVAWELANGTIPEFLYVRHLCHNRCCVNPSHLSVGTAQDNSNDSTDAKADYFKLSTRDVVTISGLALLGWSRTDIAREFAVSSITVGAILRGERRQHSFDTELDRDRQAAPGSECVHSRGPGRE